MHHRHQSVGFGTKNQDLDFRRSALCFLNTIELNVCETLNQRLQFGFFSWLAAEDGPISVLWRLARGEKSNLDLIKHSFESFEKCSSQLRGILLDLGKNDLTPKERSELIGRFVTNLANYGEALVDLISNLETYNLSGANGGIKYFSAFMDTLGIALTPLGVGPILSQVGKIGLRQLTRELAETFSRFTVRGVAGNLAKSFLGSLTLLAIYQNHELASFRRALENITKDPSGSLRQMAQVLDNLSNKVPSELKPYYKNASEQIREIMEQFDSTGKVSGEELANCITRATVLALIGVDLKKRAPTTWQRGLAANADKRPETPQVDKEHRMPNKTAVHEKKPARDKMPEQEKKTFGELRVEERERLILKYKQFEKGIDKIISLARTDAEAVLMIRQLDFIIDKMKNKGRSDAEITELLKQLRDHIREANEFYAKYPDLRRQAIERGLPVGGIFPFIPPERTTKIVVGRGIKDAHGNIWEQNNSGHFTNLPEGFEHAKGPGVKQEWDVQPASGLALKLAQLSSKRTHVNIHPLAPKGSVGSDALAAIRP
ncbi:MAG: hypothetical protein N2654_07645 [Deltaproteobacteria bacterium]|nr:hypothetical protein [Deltaproteobacteria bacterium]